MWLSLFHAVRFGMRTGRSVEVNEILTINPAFQQVIPELSEEEFVQLEANILKDGMLHPIIVWNGVIIDGHNRYKIAQKHPGITFTTYAMDFQSDYEAISWICNNQLGRRNITEPYKKCLLATRYEAEKYLVRFNGNRFTSLNESRMDTACPSYKSHGTRTRIAEEAGVSEGYIENAVQYMRGVEAAEETDPGIKKELLSERITPSFKEVASIAKIPMEERQVAVEQLRIPKEQRKVQTKRTQALKSTSEKEKGTRPSLNNPNEDVPDMMVEDKNNFDTPKERAPDIEEAILDSMVGTVNMFIDSINNYLSRFPKLRTDPKYRGKTREIMVAAKNYISDVEGDLV